MLLNASPTIAPARRRTVRGAVLLFLALLTAFGFAPTASAAPTNQEYLVASDEEADALYVYRGSDLKRTGSLDDLALSGHAGTVQLPDGRLIGIDDEAGRVVAVKINSKGRPKIVDSVDIPGDWEGAAWAVADAGLRYFAVSGGSEDAPTVSVVDLRTFALHQMAVTPAPDSSGNIPETQVYLAGKPLQLVYTTGGQFRTVPLRTLLTGGTPEVTSTAPVGPATHGPVITRTGDQVLSTTADGLDSASISGTTLTNPRSVAYSPTRNIIQVYRPRLAVDGRTVWGSAAEDTGLAPAAWADTRNDVSAIDINTHRSHLTRLPDGIAGRLAISRRYAAVTTIHPDGDVLTLLDARRSSATYRRIVGTVALPSLTHGPVAGTPTTGTESRFSALSPSGATAYVSQGGDGEIEVINTNKRRIVATIDTPSALRGGGYLTVVKAGTPISDLVAR